MLPRPQTNLVIMAMQSIYCESAVAGPSMAVIVRRDWARSIRDRRFSRRARECGRAFLKIIGRTLTRNFLLDKSRPHPPKNSPFFFLPPAKHTAETTGMCVTRARKPCLLAWARDPG